MNPRQAIRLLIGAGLLALHELLNGSGVGMQKRRNRLKGWAER